MGYTTSFMCQQALSGEGIFVSAADFSGSLDWSFDANSNSTSFQRGGRPFVSDTNVPGADLAVEVVAGVRPSVRHN